MGNTGSELGSVAAPVSGDHTTDWVARTQELSRASPVVVFSKTYCGYCSQTKSALVSAGHSHVVHELDVQPNGALMQSAIVSWTGHRTVPAVFVGGEFVGGCDDTLRALRSGTFAQMYDAARGSKL